MSPTSSTNIELSNILNIEAKSEMSNLVSSLKHISKIFFMVFIFEALIEDSNGIDRLLIEILGKLILITPCPNLNSSIVVFINFIRNVKGIHSLSYLTKDF